MKAVEMHLIFTIGLFKIRNSKQGAFNAKETEIFTKFFN